MTCPIRLAATRAGVYRVLHDKLGHVGNLKLAGGRWKFKAIGFDADGCVVPGGGHYTHRHNVSPDLPDARALARLLDG
jgi:hypothetical protein